MIADKKVLRIGLGV